MQEVKRYVLQFERLHRLPNNIVIFFVIGFGVEIEIHVFNLHLVLLLLLPCDFLSVSTGFLSFSSFTGIKKSSLLCDGAVELS